MTKTARARSATERQDKEVNAGRQNLSEEDWCSEEGKRMGGLSSRTSVSIWLLLFDFRLHQVRISSVGEGRGSRVGGIERKSENEHCLKEDRDSCIDNTDSYGLTRIQGINSTYHRNVNYVEQC